MFESNYEIDIRNLQYNIPIVSKSSEIAINLF